MCDLICNYCHLIFPVLHLYIERASHYKQCMRSAVIYAGVGQLSSSLNVNDTSNFMKFCSILVHEMCRIFLNFLENDNSMKCSQLPFTYGIQEICFMLHGDTSSRDTTGEGVALTCSWRNSTTTDHDLHKFRLQIDLSRMN